MNDLADYYKELSTALSQFQAEVPVIEKKKKAKIPTKSGGEYSYAYADLADIWEVIRPLLAKHNLAVTQMLSGGSDGSTSIITTIWHTNGSFLSSPMDVPTDGKTPQEAGSLFTYYKRYALGAALGLSTEEDDDGKSANRPPEASSNKPASEKQIGLLSKLAKDAGYGADWIADTIMKVNTSADASAIIKKLQEKVSEN